jgi:hypothetical protein
MYEENRKGGEADFKRITEVFVVLAPHSLRTLRRATLRAPSAPSTQTLSVLRACNGLVVGWYKPTSPGPSPSFSPERV